MRYSSMIKAAREKGVASEAAMFAGIEAVDELLENMKGTHPDKYWSFIRKAHESLYGCHYDDEFAKWDISQMHSTDASGSECHGAHWSKSDVENAMISKTFANGVTGADKWVAANAAWHDLHSHYTDDDVLDIAYLFFFADEDWTGKGKVWEYMNCGRC